MWNTLKTSGEHFQVNIYAGRNISCGIKIKLMTRHLVQVTDSVDTYSSPDLRNRTGAANHDPVCNHLAVYS
jgi:hypothetical protein